MCQQPVHLPVAYPVQPMCSKQIFVRTHSLAFDPYVNILDGEFRRGDDWDPGLPIVFFTMLIYSTTLK